MHVSGMTDMQIFIQALGNHGITDEHVRERIAVLSERLTAEARRITGNGVTFFELLPGVRETLEALDRHPRYRSALLTGNIEPMAYLKMELVGLEKFFTLPGAFGDESHDRRDLPALAAERIRQRLKIDLKPEQFIVIGDTPNDIACAHHFGAKALAVGTGRLYTTNDLLECSPEAFIKDFSNIELVMQTLDSL